MSTGDPRFGALPAAVPAWAALWLARQAPEMLRTASFFERNGRPDMGADLRVAVDQLRRSAAQVQEGTALPTIGSAEVAGSEIAAGSEPVGAPPRTTLTVAAAAGLLGLSERQVINLIGSRALTAAQRGRGCRWEVDRQSVLDYLQTRRSR